MRPEVTLQLDRERKAILDLNALCEFERIMGASAFTVLNEMSARSLRALIWAALHRADSKLSIDRVGELVAHVDADDPLTQMFVAAAPLIRLLRRAEKASSRIQDLMMGNDEAPEETSETPARSMVGAGS